ncbi:hypothetical protein V5O48_004952 [Marasmius crinis-equi]|uniref:Uncharacterized protein n=1 Tax=Marasmius crinis-equi TaxID=585013 RepID=A0ABR3FNK8_9AGAR
MSSTRLFAVIVGIDQYKSGDTWNLQSCVDDAKRIRRWLRDELSVPREQISMLLDENATKQNIETELANHLLRNDAIERGDAILIYFACHGSSMRAPSEWTSSKVGMPSVEILCPYDHDTKHPDGRIAGISAPAIHAFLQQLASAKGDNITLMLDSCFSPPHPSSRDRQFTRWTSTNKALPSDLTSGSFTAFQSPFNLSFHSRSATHTALHPTKPGGSANEGKDGGKFTSTFLEIARSMHLHSTPLQSLIARVDQAMGEGQHPQCSGKGASHMLFGGIPFGQDVRYVPIRYQTEKGFAIERGSDHGIAKGSEFSVHLHNYLGSRNPTIATVVVQDVHSDWCTGSLKSKTHYPISALPKRCWALINERPVVGSLLRKSCSALLQRIGIPPYRTAEDATQVKKGISRAVSYEDIRNNLVRRTSIGFLAGAQKRANTFPPSTKHRDVSAPLQTAVVA